MNRARGMMAGILMLACLPGCVAAPVAPSAPPADVCDPATPRTEFTLRVAAGELGSTIDVITRRVSELGYAAHVGGLDKNDMWVVFCQAMNDDEVASVTQLVSTSGLFGVRRVYQASASAGQGQSSPAAPTKWPSPRGTSQEASVDDLMSWQPTTKLMDAFSSWDCGGKAAGGQPVSDAWNQPLFACDNTGQKYLLGPVIVDGPHVAASVALVPSGQTDLELSIALDGEGQTRFAQATAVLAGQSSPKNRLALLVDGHVLTAPEVRDPIDGGTLQLTGLAPDDAKTLAAVLQTAATPIHVTDVSVNQVP